MPEYTFSTSSSGDYKERGSSFYAVAHSVSDVVDVKSKLLIIKEKFPNASHICYAYRIKMGQRLDEFLSDAEEPKGSAGLSILNVLKRQNLINSAIFVIRYFGGKKLGIPGLIYAYRSVSENAIQNAELIPWLEKKQLLVTYPYKLEGIMKAILQKYKVEVIHENFGEKINIQLVIDVKSTDEILNSIKEISADSAQIIIEN